MKIPPWGLQGGGDGALGEYLLVKEDSSSERLPSKCTVSLREGDTIVIRTPGGGGYGDPFMRDPSLVLKDVINGLLSITLAEKDYGVVIDPNEMEVLIGATGEKRAQKTD
ncbi:N-methylhydantoinase B/acetone carboxylase, alpha subunit [Thaumarchaeota archaeon SCGC AB-539-E09]|nr:N-methylhydantoinase B/acetone carboxylase, alpha subunit [Thaumarchaeota archaeon SCGC AB-539-E09]